MGKGKVIPLLKSGARFYHLEKNYVQQAHFGHY
jgi:hypothetical protein